MTRTYSCPHCDGVLNPGSKIILKASYKASRGLILLSPKPGNYFGGGLELIHFAAATGSTPGRSCLERVVHEPRTASEFHWLPRCNPSHA